MFLASGSSTVVRETRFSRFEISKINPRAGAVREDSLEKAARGSQWSLAKEEQREPPEIPALSLWGFYKGMGQPWRWFWKVLVERDGNNPAEVGSGVSPCVVGNMRTLLGSTWHAPPPPCFRVGLEP